MHATGDGDLEGWVAPKGRLWRRVGGVQLAEEGAKRPWRDAIGGQKGRVKVVLPLLQPSRRRNDVHAPSRYLPVARRLTVCFLF